MMDGITWKEFLTVVVLACAAWYLFVGLVFFRKEVGGFLNGSANDRDGDDSDDDGQGNVVQAEHEPTERENAFDELEATVNRIRTDILEKAGKDAVKAELLAQLQLGLAGYRGLRRPAFRIAINNFITTNAREICGVGFSDEELDEAWDEILG